MKESLIFGIVSIKKEKARASGMMQGPSGGHSM